MSARDPVSDALAQFLERRERGEAVAPEDFLREHPTLAAELGRRFTTLLRVERALGGRAAATSAGEEPPTAGSGEATRLRGRRLGPYRLVARIGLGSMGTVYRARVEADADGLLRGQSVAVKVFHPALLGREQLAARFRREGQIGLTFRHVNLVRAFALGATEVEGQAVPYLVMEHVEGEDLGRRLARLAPLPERFCRRLARAVARALAALAVRGVVHRDLKPQNVMLGADGSIKVMDFGLARLLDASARLTQSGTFVGSVVYAAPEQLEHTSLGVDARADLYALGLLLYEAATGVLPWPNEGLGEALRRRRSAPAPSVAATRPGLSAFFDAVVTTLLQPEREARFADAETLLAVLEEEESSAWWQARRRASALVAEGEPPARRARRATRPPASAPRPAPDPAAGTLCAFAVACLGTWSWHAVDGGAPAGESRFSAGPQPGALVEDSRWGGGAGSADAWPTHGVWTFAPERHAVSVWWFEAAEPDPGYLFGTLSDTQIHVRGRATGGLRHVDLRLEDGRLRARLEREGQPPLDLVGERTEPPGAAPRRYRPRPGEPDWPAGADAREHARVHPAARPPKGPRTGGTRS